MNKSPRNTSSPSLLLINPKQQWKHYSLQSSMVSMLGKKNTIPPLSLALLAALTPENYDIRIIDEEAEPIPNDLNADLVGITTSSNTIARAYEIADTLRAQGMKVVLGGPHVTYTIAEGLCHADAIVVGEAEPSWPRLLEDFENGRLEQVYRSLEKISFNQSPVPRWDLIDKEAYLSFPVQVTRGCPYKCEFCLVTEMFGKRIRCRDLDNVEEEIRALPARRIFFVDDNLTINKRFARRLFTRLRKIGVSWVCQASIDVGKDKELLGEMADAGCEQILIGFESLNPDSLEETHKHHNLRADYHEAVKNIHAAGIHVIGGFIIGFDHDTLDDLDRIEGFCAQEHISFVTLNILGSSPGTPLYERLKSQGRILNVPPELKGGMFPGLRYHGFSGPELLERYLETLERIYSFETIYNKAKGLFGDGAFSKGKVYDKVDFRQKAGMSLKILKSYLMTKDKNKRALFGYLFDLIRNKILAPERAVLYLLSMEGLTRHISSIVADKERLMATARERL